MFSKLSLWLMQVNLLKGFIILFHRWNSLQPLPGLHVKEDVYPFLLFAVQVTYQIIFKMICVFVMLVVSNSKNSNNFFFPQLIWHFCVREGHACSLLAPKWPQLSAKNALKKIWSKIKFNVGAIKQPSQIWCTTWLASAEGGGRCAWAAEPQF